MGLDDLPLGGRQTTRLGKDVARDADLADVMKQRPELELLQCPLVEPERLTDASTVLTNVRSSPS